MASEHSEATAEQFPIRELSARTQVNTVTIRAWERRYGLLKPQRTAKGHRLYTQDDVHRVEAILAWIARGVPLSKIKSLLHQEHSTAEAEAIVADDNWSDQVEELIKCARQFSSTRIEALLNEKLIQYPPSVCLEKWLKPAFEALRHCDDYSDSAAQIFTENEILRYSLVRLSAKKTAKGKPFITLTHGDKAPLWRMAVIALELADGDYRVQLISQSMQEQTWLAMTQTADPPTEKKTAETIHVFYQDGFWKEEIGQQVANALSSKKNLAVCGSAPMVFGLNTPNQVFSDLEQYAAFQLAAT